MEKIREEIIDVEEAAVETVETEEKKSVVDWVKKHSKKIVKGAIVAGGLLAAYAIGKNSGSSNDTDCESCFDDSEDSEIISEG